MSQTQLPFAEDDAGSSMIEFAIGVTVLLMLVYGIIDLSRALYVDHFVAGAASEGARYAMVRGSTFNNVPCNSTLSSSCTATSSAVSAYVQSLAPAGVSVSDLTVTTSWPGTGPTGANCVTAVTPNNGPGCIVRVTVTDSFNFVVPYLPPSVLNLSSTSAVAISQ